MVMVVKEKALFFVTFGFHLGSKPARCLAKRCGPPKWRHGALLLEFLILGPALFLDVHLQANFFPSLGCFVERGIGLSEHWHPLIFGICSASPAGPGFAGWL